MPKALCFVALQYHDRVLLPVMAEMEKRGYDVVYTTAPAEAGFEMNLVRRGVPYLHPLDYQDAVKSRVEEAWRSLRRKWNARMEASRWSLQAVPATIQDKLLRCAVENFYCFEEMIRAEKPDVVFALQELNSWGKILGYHCHRQGIPYVTFQEGLCYGHPFLYQLHTEYSTKCVVWGNADAKMLLETGAKEAQIARLGSVDLWPSIKQTNEPEYQRKLREELQLPADVDLILFLMGHANYNQVQAQNLLAWQVYRGKLALAFKWHPALSRDVIQRASQGLVGPYVYNLHDFDTYGLLALAKVCVIVGNSTTGIEALAYGKPLIEILLPNLVYSYAQKGVAEPCPDLIQLVPKVEAALGGKWPVPRENVERYLADHFAFQDCETASRAADLTVRLVAESQQKNKAEAGVSPRTVGGDGQPKPIFVEMPTFARPL